MKSITLTISFSLFFIFAQGQIKLITPGEHLIYSLDSFDDENELLKVTIEQGETWTAVYTQNGYFKTRVEVISWDTTNGFQIMSDTIKQPRFYTQNLPHISGNGPGTEFSWKDFRSSKPLIFTLLERKYFLLYSDDPNCERLTSKNYGQIESENQLTVFKDVSDDSLRRIQLNEEHIVKLFWAGDLNGDEEPDFLIALRSHHETLILELIVSVINNRTTKRKRVARFTESS